jgi:hypothetical protein
MANDAKPQVQAFRTRITKLDDNGVPTPGASKVYVTGALTALTTNPVYVDGDEFEEKNGGGEICVSFKGPDTFKRIDWELTICTPDPYLLEMLSGGDVLTDGAAVGFAYPALGPMDPTPISIELWTKRVDEGVIDSALPYAWWVLPWCDSMRLGSKTFGNNAILPAISGRAFENDNWFDGPTNNWDPNSDRVLQYIPCTAADLPAVTAPAYGTVATS